MIFEDKPFDFEVLPRVTLSWDQFAQHGNNLIALDGVVGGGPRFDLKHNRFNFDHHAGVIREVTMCTARQVYFALKGAMIQRLTSADGSLNGTIFINDTDQDSSLAAWLLQHHEQFTRGASNPTIGRLLELTDRLDVTGGAFPMNLRGSLERRHNWVFAPYSEFRKSGGLATAKPAALYDNLMSVFGRLNKFVMGEAEEKPFDICHDILYQGKDFWIVDEIGGNEARYHLFQNGMTCYISLVARLPDNKFVYTVGKASQYYPFPVESLYKAFNEAEGLTCENGWNGSTIIGGSPRATGSRLSWEQLCEITLEVLRKNH